MISELLLMFPYIPFNVHYQMFQLFFSIVKYSLYKMNHHFVPRNRIIIERISEKEEFVLLDIKEI
jgi:hypothetical protein